MFISFFIISYFFFLNQLYIVPNNFEFPIFVFIGFSFIIITFFLILLWNSRFENTFLNFSFLNENFLKLILIILMLLTFIIKPVSFSQSIMDWDQISPLNILRAAIIIIASAFIPGSSLFNIIFPRNNLHTKLKVEPYILKLTIYPLISFAILGFFTLVLDFIGILNIYFSFALLFFIIILYLCDVLIQKYKWQNYKLKTYKLNITKTAIIIFIIAIGIITIAYGIHLSSQYLIPGDSWRGVKYAYYVGNPEANPYSKFYGGYTVYWGYISFALRSLSGIPSININVFLLPFLYLYVTSLYLFLKALLPNYKTLYIIFSILLIITFSGLFYSDNLGLTPRLSLHGLIQFSFYSFSYFSLFTALAIFLAVIKSSNNLNFKHFYKNENLILLIISAWLFLNSYILYFFPAIAGISFIIIYLLFSNQKNNDLKTFLVFLVIIWIFFFIYDFLCTFYFSLVPLNFLHYFFGTIQPPISNPNVLLYCALIVNISFFCFILMSYLIYKIYLKYNQKEFKNYYQVNIKVIFIIFLAIITISLIIQITFNIILKMDQGFFFFFLDLIFLNIGFIGIYGIYSTYRSYILDKKIFYLLTSWLIFMLVCSSILILYNWLKYTSLYVSNIPEYNYFSMMWWFSRNWYIIIIPLSIFSSIGLIKFGKYISHQIYSKTRNINILYLIKMFSIAGLIFLSVSNTIIYGIYWSDKGDANAAKPIYIDDDDAQIMGWVSKNVPHESNILIDRYPLYHLIDIAICPTSFIWEEIEDLSNKYNTTRNSILNESIQLFIKNLKEKNFTIFIMKEINENEYYYLLRNYYNITLYSYGRLIIYSTPTTF